MNTLSKILNFQVMALLALLALGQLTRIQLTPTIAVYVHDIWIIGMWLVWLTYQGRDLEIWRVPGRFWLWKVFTLIALTSLVINAPVYGWSGGLYLVRWALYMSVGILVYQSIQAAVLKIDVRGGVIATLVFIASAGIAQYIWLPDVRFLYELGWDDHLNRLISTHLDPGFTGILMGWGLVSALLVYPRKAWLQAIFLTALVLTYARSAFVVTGIVLVVGWVLERHSRWLVALALLIGMILFLPQTQGEGVKLARTQSITSRAHSSVSALELFSQQPILGFGFNNYRQASDKAISEYPDHVSAPDNSFLLVLVTTGIVGGTVFGAALLSLLWWSWRNSHETFVVLMLLIGHSFTNNSLFHPFILLLMWIWLGSEMSRGKESSGWYKR